MAAVLGSRTTWQLRYHQLPDRSKNSISSKIASRTTSNQQKVQKLPADKYIFDRCKIKNENSKIQNFKWIESRPRNRTTEHATEATRKKHQLCNFNFCNFKFCNFGNIETHRHSHRISSHAIASCIESHRMAKAPGITTGSPSWTVQP
jgi:hypothetical protein